MVWLKVLDTAPSRDINLPADVVHRSVDGDTLFIVPGQSHEYTEEEWAHIQKSHSEMLPWFQLLGPHPTPARQSQPPAPKPAKPSRKS